MTTNFFGGGNANSLYVPMSDVEQEAISRLVGSGDLRVIVVGWGHVDSPRIKFGDSRIQVTFTLDFHAPELPMPVPYFDLELKTRTGILLAKSRLPTAYDGNALQVAAGITLTLVWDIQVKAIDPNLVKQVVPDARGLTSRRVDKDTGFITEVGNMRLTDKGRKLLNLLAHGERAAKIHRPK